MVNTERWWLKLSKGFLLVISGPSGSGKGTVSNQLLNRNEDVIFSVSATTRKPRIGEVDGLNYIFINEESFKEMIEKDKFLEHAFVHNNYYGTPRDFVMEQIEKGEIVLLEIDVQGAMQIKKNYKEAVFIFLLPPTMDELKNRIIKRGTESEEDINRRFENAFKELDFVGEYDYFVVNEKVDEAVSNIESIIVAEKLRVKRQSGIKEKITSKGGK
jgi:guanylate kinase